jgi:energy-coupling factor transporter ATP-binding protein EcfA2
MDRESADRLFATLGKLKGKATILIVTHDMDFVSPLTDRVLCLGDEEEGRNYGIVQHPTEEAAHGSRIIHSDSIAADDCCEDGMNRE